MGRKVGCLVGSAVGLGQQYAAYLILTSFTPPQEVGPTCAPNDMVIVNVEPISVIGEPFPLHNTNPAVQVPGPVPAM